MKIVCLSACAVMLGLAWLGTSEAAQDSQVNCNEIMAEDRCACNERVLLALTTLRRIVPDPNLYANVGEIPTAIAIQQEQRNRLRTYYAPGDCGGPASPDKLPLAAPHVTNRLYGGWSIDKHLKPLRTEIIDSSDLSKLSLARKLLVGRWDGWQTLYGGKPTPVSIHVISVGTPRPLAPLQPSPYVKACSDQGMVVGQVRDGYVELPRVDSTGAVYSIRLWRSLAPRSRDLEGVVLLEVRPGETLVAGLVSLSRAPKFDWTGPPSNYFCQDRDLEEQRRDAEEEQRRTLP